MDFTGIEPEFLLQLYQRLVLGLLWVFAGSACLLTIVFLLLCSLEYFSSPRRREPLPYKSASASPGGADIPVCFSSLGEAGT